MFFRSTLIAHKTARKPYFMGLVVLKEIIYKEYQKNIKTLGNPVFSRVFFMSECLQKVVKNGGFFMVAHT